MAYRSMPLSYRGPEPSSLGFGLEALLVASQLAGLEGPELSRRREAVTALAEHAQLTGAISGDSWEPRALLSAIDEFLANEVPEIPFEECAKTCLDLCAWLLASGFVEAHEAAVVHGRVEQTLANHRRCRRLQEALPSVATGGVEPDDGQVLTGAYEVVGCSERGLMLRGEEADDDPDGDVIVSTEALELAEPGMVLTGCVLADDGDSWQLVSHGAVLPAPSR